MLEVIILFLLGIFWIIFASVEDLRTREVANWVSFSLIIFALGFRFFYSLFFEQWNFFYQGVFGFVLFLILGNLFYYARLFAGGDAKLFISMGPILSFSESFLSNVNYFLVFIILFLMCGAIYGLLFTFYLSFRNWKKFKKQFKIEFKRKKNLFLILVLAGIVVFFAGFFEGLLFILGALLILFPALLVYARSVDNSCMVKVVLTKNLTEGDWLYEPLKFGKELLSPSWEGLGKKDILKIRRKYKKIKIKQGIPFVPVFFFSYLVYFYIFIEGLWNAFW